MSTRAVTIKWNKVVLNLDLDAAETMASLKAKIVAQTNVPEDRQKLMNKGKLVKDDASVSSIAAGAQLVLMGTADEAPIAPTRKIVFEEDLTTEQKTKLNVEREAPGYKNLGNTCYMNSTLQCLRAIPEFRNALETHSLVHPLSTEGTPTDPQLLTHALAKLYQKQDQSSDAVVPSLFVAALRRAFPQFDERTRGGGIHSQQDADECLSQLLQTLSTELKDVPTSKAINRGHGNWVDMLFTGEMESTLTPTEEGAKSEVVRKSVEEFRKLRCSIGNNTNYLIEGLKDAMTEEITKRSPKLGRDAVYLRKSHISKLPQYMVVQFVRFFWRTDNGEKTKIVRRVQFPMRLDTLDLTGGDLRSSLVARRAATLAEQDERLGITQLNKEKAEAKAAAAAAASTSTSASSPTPSPPAAPVASASGMQDNDKAASSSSSSSSSSSPSPSSPNGGESEKKTVAPNPTTSGFYDLISVVTHKGRDADSGHYVGWVRQSPEKWLKYDDDVVTSIPATEIEKLSGGSDWHTAYIAIYARVDDVAASATSGGGKQ